MRPASVMDYRELARRRLPRMLFDYIDGGSYAETTLRRNVTDFEDIALRQRVLAGMDELDMAVETLGQRMTMPVGLAPVGMSGMYARRGETQAARAAQAAGVPFCLSTVGLCSVEEVTAAAQPPWFQLYMMKDRGYMRELLDRAKALGCPVLLFTVDLPVAGARYRDVRSGYAGGAGLSNLLTTAWQGLQRPEWLWDVYLHGRPHTLGSITAAVGAGGLTQYMAWIGRNFDRAIGWKDIDWIREAWDRPLVIKGVLDPADAREVARLGAQGVVVSNHGGRQLDSALSTIRALPRIVDAVGDDLEVYLDGGIRSGLDVLKAMALGAKACFVGRAWAYALGAGGERTVGQMLATIRAELATAMILTGCKSLRGADRSLIDVAP